MKKVLLVFGAGGHTTSALILNKDLKKIFTVEYMVEKNDPIVKAKLSGENLYSTTAIKGKSEPKIFIPFRSLACFLESLVIFFKTKPDIIMSTGPGIAVPISIIGRVFGKKVFFLESWARVTTKSNAGKVMYYIANRFFVSWPEMKKKYPKAIYAGRLG